MTDRRRRIADEWITALSESLGVFGALVIEAPVIEAWSDASNLDGYTVGGIAGHVLSLVVGLQGRIESGATGVEPIRYVDWYGPALSSETVHSGLIELGEELAAAGPANVAAGLDAASAGLVRCLRGVRADFVVPLASIHGAGVRLDDFLRTRFVEITVHADDIASSIGRTTPNFPATAWTLAARVITETGVVGTGANLVVACNRPRQSHAE